MTNFDIMLTFPKLDTASKFEIKSPCTKEYNCIAWAAGEDDRWWWPDKSGDKYWPESIPRAEKLSAFVQAFESLDYVECNNGDLEDGFEKIAIYTKPAGTPAHAARQLSDGVWTSKLGNENDIIHHQVIGVEGTQYGKVAVFMKRPRLQ
jgi:hypothetical protein